MSYAKRKKLDSNVIDRVSRLLVGSCSLENEERFFDLLVYA